MPRHTLAQTKLSAAIACTGPIPVELLRWKFVEGRTIELKRNAGLEIPSNIGELGDSVTKIDLSGHFLRGAWYDQAYRARKRIEKRIARAGTLPMMPPSLEVLNMQNAGKFTGGIPSEWGSLTNLKSLDMRNCGLDGASLWV